MRSSQALVVSTTVAAVTVATALYLKKPKKDDPPARRAKYACDCGKVQADIVIPTNNYKYMEIPSIQCLCNDCVGFVDKVLSHSKSKDTSSFLSPGISNLVLYDSEVDITSGTEYLCSMKLSKRSPNRRIYSLCCATPMAISIIGTGTSLIYSQNIRKDEKNNETTDIPDLPAIACFHVNSKAKQEDYPDLKLVQGQFAPKEISYCIGRLALLSLVGNKGPGQGFPLVGELDIGMDSIEHKFASKQ